MVKKARTEETEMSTIHNNRPLIPEVGILALVPDGWFDLWQPRHYVLATMARYFQVLWVPPAPDWRGMFCKPNGRMHVAPRLNLPGLYVYDPVFRWPKLYRPSWLAGFTFNARLKLARRLLTQHGCHRIILYLWRPEFAAALDSIPFDLSCYHIDDEYSFADVETPPDAEERRLIAKVNQVFIHSPRLLERKGTINPNTALIPNGVDFEAYARPVPEPRDLSIIPRPRIGYTGVLKKQLDWQLMLNLVKRHRGWSFVFVGPQSSHVEIIPMIQELSRQPNVYFLGRKSPEDLAAYPQHFDACMMPYRINGYTNNIYPLKLHEYLASGRPIVGSPVRSLQDFSKVIALAADVNEWSRALECALAPTAVDAKAVTTRQEIARQYDWKHLVQTLVRVLCERLGANYLRHFDQAALLSSIGITWCL